MLQVFRKFFFRILYCTGLGHLLKYRNTKRYFVPILLFHRVSDAIDDYWAPMSTHAFKEIINFFKKKYTIRSVEDLFILSPDELKESFFIVFDDAYKDFQENALPVLKGHNIPVTMFIPVDSINTGKPIWTTWLNMCIDQAVTKTVRISGAKYDISEKASKIQTAKLLTTKLKALPNEEFRKQFDEILQQTGENVNRPDISVMTWNEINDTIRDVDYQSHTMSHPMLENILDEKILAHEIGNSKQIIEKEIRKVVSYISYPIGSYSPATMEMAKRYYQAAFAVDERLVDLNSLNDSEYKYRIPRFNVSDNDPYELFFRVNGFHKFLGR